MPRVRRGHPDPLSSLAGLRLNLPNLRIRSKIMATVHIPPALRKYTQGQEEVAVDGGNVRDLLGNLEKSFPGIGERIVDDSGVVRRFVNVFVADEDIRFMDNLETAVKDADEVSIIPAIAGGW